jgi:hypothetical protein
MKLLKFVSFVGLLTLLSLIYINLQMQIFDLAYQGKKKENAIRELSDRNGIVTSDILKMTSANHLGLKVLAPDSQMQFRNDQDVVRLETAEMPLDKPLLASSKTLEKTQKIFSNLFLFITQAEAKPVER